MASFSRSLEEALHRALSFAGERNHEYATLEHLLLALVDDQDAAAVMRACEVDLDLLRQDLLQYILGACVLAIVAGIAVFVVAYTLLSIFRKKRNG